MRGILTCDCGVFIDELCKCHKDNLCRDCHDVEYEESK